MKEAGEPLNASIEQIGPPGGSSPAVASRRTSRIISIVWSRFH
jgi:hypothetical protein